MIGDLVSGIIGIINFVLSYRVYCKLEKGIITMKQAGLDRVKDVYEEGKKAIY